MFLYSFNINIIATGINSAVVEAIPAIEFQFIQAGLVGYGFKNNVKLYNIQKTAKLQQKIE